jgi:predicted DNA-binding transcriptional regulator YafY
MSQTERVAYIDNRIKTKGGVTARQVAERFEVTERQVTRDIEYLRDRLGAPIEWARSERRYRYSMTWSGLDFADETALLFYVFARAAAGTLAYVPLAEDGALGRLLELVPKALRKAEGAIRYELSGYEPADIDTLGLLVRSIAEGRRIDASYRDAEGNESERGIEPRRLVNYSGTWYCVAYDLERRALRTFKLSRFRRVSISRDKAQGKIEDAEVENFLASSFGMFKGKGDKRAVIRFRGRAVPIVRDELWHPDQSRREGVDPDRGPYVELTIPVSSWDELLGRILRFGAEAEPVSPAPLRKLWKEEIVRMSDAAGLPPRS